MQQLDTSIQTNIDIDLYSRQIFSIGESSTRRLLNSNILVRGLDKVGIEIVRNCILSGIKSVDIEDDRPVVIEEYDNFYCKPIMATRLDEGLIDSVRSLGSCNIELVPKEMVATKYDVVILVNQQFFDVLDMNRECHSNVKFINVECSGNECHIFCDFDKHVITDLNGQPAKSCRIGNIERDVVRTMVGQTHDFSKGDCITMENGEDTSTDCQVIEVLDNTCFIVDVSFDDELAVNLKNHKCTQIKKQTIVNHQIIDHSCLLYPDAQRGCQYIQAIASIAAAVATQQTINGIINKYRILDQRYHYTCPNFDMGLIRNFSKRVFIVGAGAIGCELIKNFGVDGVRSLDIIDMDTIEKSNLPRQFLYKREDIGKSKSLSAARRVAEFASSNINAFDCILDKSTLNKFNSTYFDDVGIIVNALDNYDARLTVDKLAHIHNITVVDTGIYSTQGSIQIIQPCVTVSYSSIPQDPKTKANSCTIKNFPFKPEHLVAWAKERFVTMFAKNNQDDLNNIDPISIFNSDYNEDIQNILKEYVNKDKESEKWIKTPTPILFDLADQDHERYITNFKKVISNAKSCSEFDKDNTVHVDFIKDASNLRGKNFGLDEISYLDCQRIAGNVIPALLTTTALTSGLASIEVYKLITERANVANWYLDLATNIFCEFGPSLTQDVRNPLIINIKQTATPNFDEWTVEFLLEECKTRNVLPSCIIYDTQIIYSDVVDSDLNDLLCKLTNGMKDIILEYVTDEETSYSELIYLCNT